MTDKDKKSPMALDENFGNLQRQAGVTYSAIEEGVEALETALDLAGKLRESIHYSYRDGAFLEDMRELLQLRNPAPPGMIRLAVEELKDQAQRGRNALDKLEAILGTGKSNHWEVVCDAAQQLVVRSMAYEQDLESARRGKSEVAKLAMEAFNSIRLAINPSMAERTSTPTRSDWTDLESAAKKLRETAAERVRVYAERGHLNRELTKLKADQEIDVRTISRLRYEKQEMLESRRRALGEALNVTDTTPWGDMVEQARQLREKASAMPSFRWKDPVPPFHLRVPGHRLYRDALPTLSEARDAYDEARGLGLLGIRLYDAEGEEIPRGKPAAYMAIDENEFWYKEQLRQAATLIRGMMREGAIATAAKRWSEMIEEKLCAYTSNGQ